MKTVFIFILLTFLSGCSLSEGLDDEKEAIDYFHQLFSAEDYDGIYANSTDQLKQTTSKEEFFSIIKSFREVLGAPVSTKMQNFRLNTSIGAGTTYTGVYVTQFENGVGTETFVFKKEDDGMKLQSYNLNSNDYIRMLRERAAI